MSVSRRVVVVTGASSGVGRATARAFGACGDVVALIARNADGLKEAAREVEAAGGHAQVIPADVADAVQVEESADAVEAGLGPIDIWINNAMVSVFSPVWNLTADEVARVTAVNYLGTVYGTLAALKRMRRRDTGTIVQVGSALAHRAIPVQAAYCASKHAIRGFTESVRAELMHDGSGIRITIVELPGLNTPHFTMARSRMPRRVRPVPPIFAPDVAARAILHAADHPRRREYVVGGVTAALILAQKIAPGLIDRYLARTGFDAQMTSEPTAPRPGNLFEPLPGDPGTAGPFPAEAHDRSAYFWAARHRWLLAGVAGLGAAALRARRA